MNKLIAALIVLLLVGVGLFFFLDDQDEPQTENNQTSSQNQANDSNQTSTPVDSPNDQSPELTLAEVAKHTDENDCWMVIDGNVYDMTDFIQSEDHPGGDKILKGCGQDATSLFNGDSDEGRAHSPNAESMLNDYLLGALVN